MKRIMIAAAGVMALAAPAAAADLPVSMPVKAPVVAPFVYNWSGCYIGAQLGGVWGRADWVTLTNTTAFGDTVAGQGYSNRGTGVIGGGHIGCNVQYTNWVFGLEGQLNATSLRASLANTVFGAADDVFTWRSRWIGSLTGKVGIAFSNWLIYGKGGFAFANYSLSVSDVVGANVGAGSDSHTHHGWTLGLGVDYGLTPNWILGVAWDYYRFNTQTYQLAGTAAPASFTFAFQPRDVHALTARISYKFGPTAVIAKY